MKQIKVIELFAGVGGFRLGLEQASNAQYRYDTIWSNQFEPSTNVQHASNIYMQRFADDTHLNVDITQVATDDIPDHDLLVGGFPCQDYSVAKILSHAHGIVGKKGVLWWEIYRIIKAKRPVHILLENVDRLIKSPTHQKGRDFAIMLKTLSDLGYNIEWRVINAADYGMPQRRKRVFIYASCQQKRTNAKAVLFKNGLFAQSFPIHESDLKEVKLVSDELQLSADKDPAASCLQDISDNFGREVQVSAFSGGGQASMVRFSLSMFFLIIQVSGLS